MKTKRSKRILSCILAAAMLTSTANLLSVSAADSIPMTGEQAKKDNQPRFNGYRIWDIRDWTPEADEGSEFLVAKVPLQNRNEAYKPTQVNPDLDSDAQIMLMQGDYGNAFVDGMMYNNTFGYHTLNYWQYVDYFSPWHGAASQNTPVDLHDWNYENTANRGWEKRYFEFGVLNIPNPAYTNAAHKNGVLSVACLYFDQYYRPGQTINELFAMDENGKFPVAEKLIEMADYFGYDGYFFNAEEGVYSEFLNENRKKKFLARLEEAGLYTQYYGANGNISGNASYLQDEIDGVTTKIQDSVFVNYDWNNTIDSQWEYMKQNNIDPFEQVFYGIENNGGKFDGSYNPGSGSSRYLENLYEQGTKKLRASLALFTPSDFYQRDIDGDKLQNTNYQWMIAERERMFFSGVKQDPTNTGWQSGFGRPDLGINDASKWVGVADFASERSVINGTVFNTNFSVGKGVQYYVDGAVSSDEEWSNINIQDILPTWQWWIDAEGDTKLNADFDYGPKEVRKDMSGNDITLPYTQVGAYKGGNSLVVYGDINAQNKLHLFKTDLEVKDTTKANITFKKSSDDAVAMKLGIILKDGTTDMTALDIENSAAKGDWVTSEVDLSAYAGQNIAAIGLVFDGEATGYQMNIGGIQVTDGANYTPAAPQGFEISRAFTGDEMIVNWNLDDFDTVDRYEIYATLSNGDKFFVGGIFDNIYYIKSLKNEQDVASLELVAVGKDGSKSAPATVVYDYNKSVSNIQVENEVKEVIVTDTAVVKGHITQSAEEGALNLSWTNPTANYSYLEIKVTMDDSADTESWSMTVPKGQTSARIEVPRYNGEKYNASIVAVFPDGSKGAPMNVTGKVKDTYSAPFAYDGDNVRIRGNSFTVWCPQSPDWFKLHISLDGTYLQFTNGFNAFTTPHAIRAGTKMTSSLPASSGMLKFVIEDYTGNFSEPYQIFLQDGQLLPLTTEIDETMIPDPVLRAYIKENIGATIQDLLGFEGAIDLSGTEVADLTGINLLGKVTELNISDTAISDFAPVSKLNGLLVLKANNTSIAALTNGMLPSSLENLELSGCTALTEVREGVLSKLASLKSVDLSNNTALTELYLNDSKAETVNISGCTEVTTLVATGAAVKELDISACTKVVNLKLNDGNLEKLTAAAGSAYTDIYIADFSGNKLDMSEGTPERTLVNELEAYIAENPITPVEAEPKNIAVGASISTPGTSGGYYDSDILVDGSTSRGYFTIGEGKSAIIDLGSAQQIKKWAVYFDGASYRADSFKMEYSLDGENYTLIDKSDITGNSQASVIMELDTPVTGRYFKYTTVKNAGWSSDLKEIELYAGGFMPSGVVYDNQKPAAYIDYNEIPESVTILQNGAELLVKNYFDACYANAKTVRGTLFSSLEGLDWVAADYDIAAQIQVPADITAVIIDADGNETEDPLVAAATGAYTVEFRNEAGEAVASMTIKVVADKAELNKLIDSCADLKEEAYTAESWAAFAEQLDAAKALIEQEFAAQSDVDNGFINLLIAKSGLVQKAEKGVLNTFIEIAEALDTTNNTPATVKALEEALAAAKTVYENANATQEEVDAASQALSEAITNLLDIVDNTRLVNLIKTAEATDTSKYTAESVEALQKALDEANAVAVNKDATEEEITTAYKNLANALANLVVDVNRSALANTIAIAEDILANIDDYRPSTVKGLKAATDKAKTVLENQNATQEEINAAAEELAAVIAQARVVAVKVKLVEAVEKAEQIDTEKYSEATVRALLSALEEAKAIVNDVEAEQETVDAAEQKLNTAINSLQAIASGDDNKGDNSSDANKGDNSSDTNKGNTSTGTNPPKTSDNDSKGNSATTGDNTLPLVGSVIFLLLSAGALLVLRKRRA